MRRLLICQVLLGETRHEMRSDFRPTIFATLPDKRRALFILAISLARSVGKIHDTTAYLLSVHAITVSLFALSISAC